MSRKTTHSHLIEARARAMRFDQTRTEEALWRELRGGKLGAVVRRQYVVGRYIADLAPGTGTWASRRTSDRMWTAQDWGPSNR